MNTKPLNKHLLYFANAHLVAIIREAIELASMTPERMVKSCISCDSFNEEAEVCNRFNARPPARVIAFACDSYYSSNESIPF